MFRKSSNISTYKQPPPSGQPTKDVTKGEVLRQRKTSTLARLKNFSFYIRIAGTGKPWLKKYEVG